MKPAAPSKIDSQPAIAKWELWSIAQMLVATRGTGAEDHAEGQIAAAKSVGDEAAEIVWTGIITQLQRIRAGDRS